jgi:hypothetical protein
VSKTVPYYFKRFFFYEAQNVLEPVKSVKTFDVIGE